VLEHVEANRGIEGAVDEWGEAEISYDLDVPTIGRGVKVDPDIESIAGSLEKARDARGRCDFEQGSRSPDFGFECR
jgi:hypothetical protein